VKRLPSLILLVVLQVVIPAIIVAVGLDAYLGGVRGRATQAMMAIGALWLAVGLAMCFLRSRPQVASRINDANLLVVVVIVCAITLEIGISAVVPTSRSGISRMPRPPGIRLETSNAEAEPGQRITTRFSTNELGLRGAPVADGAGAYKVLAVGGSTTENFVLDDSMAWPYLLQGNIERDRGAKAWVQNAGVSGHTAVDHIMTLKATPVAASVDLIVILVGVNDLTAALSSEGRTTEAYLVHRANENFGLFPLYSRSAIFKLAKVLTSRGEMQYEVPDDFYRRMRDKRHRGSTVPVPNLDLSLLEYRGRVQRLTQECQRLGRRCVLLTQPTLWRDNLGAEELVSLWLGYVGPLENPRGYSSPAELAVAMSRFNGELLRTAQEAHVEAFDLAAHVPKTTANFYDDCHFTNEGSRVVAEKIAEYLRSQGPSTPR
jgi:lysophospholipase L1-like esterase